MPPVWGLPCGQGWHVWQPRSVVSGSEIVQLLVVSCSTGVQHPAAQAGAPCTLAEDLGLTLQCSQVRSLLLG